MAERVTIQDIADALGVSRNTVSKAINNTGILAEKTKERILEKAVEMGYKQVTYMNLAAAKASSHADEPEAAASDPAAAGKGVIALLSTSPVGDSHFAVYLLDKLQRELSMAGYSFTTHRITRENLSSLTLPASFFPDMVSGIVCVEVFSMEYSRFLCGLGIPVLFVDAPAMSLQEKLSADILLMDNRTQIMEFTQIMLSRGHTSFGFAGPVNHCRSFAERYLGLADALTLHGIDTAASLRLFSDGFYHPRETFYSAEKFAAYLKEQISGLDLLPGIMVCANDFVAMDLYQVLKELGIRVPDDICILGFDDSRESAVISPALSTVHIDARAMGEMAARLLLQRIGKPQMTCRTVYCETSLILRESTRD